MRPRSDKAESEKIFQEACEMFEHVTAFQQAGLHAWPCFSFLASLTVPLGKLDRASWQA